MRDFFPKEYDKIAALNIELSKKYQRERDTNDADDNLIDKFISFHPLYINSLFIKKPILLIKNYLLAIHQSLCMRMADIKNLDELKDISHLFISYSFLQDDEPSSFKFSRHKEEATFPVKVKDS